MLLWGKLACATAGLLQAARLVVRFSLSSIAMCAAPTCACWIGSGGTVPRQSSRLHPFLKHHH